MKIIKNIQRMRRYRKLVTQRNNIGYQPHHADPKEHKHHLEAAQKLHAETYLRYKYITSDDLGSDGKMHKKADPYQVHSKYFVVRNSKGKVVMTARQIMAKRDHGHNSFPTMKQLDIYPQMKKFIEDFDPHYCVEISGLAKAKGEDPFITFLLYRQMWQYSVKHGHKLWIMACDDALYKRFKFLFGDALIQIGDKSYYMGSDVMPVVVEVQRALANMIKASQSLNPYKRKLRKELLEFFLHGLPHSYLEPQYAEGLQQINIAESSG